MRPKELNSIKIAKTAKGDIETLASFRIFKLEFNRLHKLYDNSINAYQIAREVIYSKIKTGEIEAGEEITFESYENNKFRIARPQSSAHNLRVQYPKYLRELIFVRLISAFEIFLIDSIKEIFWINKNMLNFNQEEILKIPEQEFFAYSSIEEAQEKLVDKKCRNLHSQGYQEIKKFYLKSLKIDLSQSQVDLSKISKYHDQRHLLVHQLGRTDSRYQHVYSTDEKLLTINESYLLETSKDINSLALYINTALINKSSVHQLFEEGRNNIIKKT